jgi:hypothetical protein
MTRGVGPVGIDGPDPHGLRLRALPGYPARYRNGGATAFGARNGGEDARHQGHLLGERPNGNALVAQLAEAADLKSAQCRFESDRGHGSRAVLQHDFDRRQPGPLVYLSAPCPSLKNGPDRPHPSHRQNTTNIPT